MKGSHCRETLMTFLDEANNFQSSIKFTAEISNEQQHRFLDTESRLVGDTIFIGLYTKYTPVSLNHKLPPETLLQKCSLQPCISPRSRQKCPFHGMRYSLTFQPCRSNYDFQTVYILIINTVCHSVLSFDFASIWSTGPYQIPR